MDEYKLTISIQYFIINNFIIILETYNIITITIILKNIQLSKQKLN